MKLSRYEENPIITPDERHSWESLVTTNPGAWYDAEQRRVVMLYRAAGRDPKHVVHLGLATSQDGYHFERASDPVFSPSRDGFDAGCVEDPRIVKFGECFFITYAARPFPPGEYWRNDKASYRPPKCPPEFPQALRENLTSSGLLITRDFKEFIRAGRLTDPGYDDRNVILFPERINGRFAMLHRPMQWTGDAYGTEQPAIWIATGDDVLNLRDSRLLAKPKHAWEGCKVGANTPPLRTEHGWLLIYHAVGQDQRYRLGAMLLDLAEPGRVLHRTPDWIMEPEADYEFDGPYPGCVFPCGKAVIGDTLFVYYGAADKYVAVATCRLQDLLDHLLASPA